MHILTQFFTYFLANARLFSPTSPHSSHHRGGSNSSSDAARSARQLRDNDVPAMLRTRENHVAHCAVGSKCLFPILNELKRVEFVGSNCQLFCFSSDLETTAGPSCGPS